MESEYKVDINIQDRYGDTALMEATEKGYTDIVKLLQKYSPSWIRSPAELQEKHAIRKRLR